MKTKNDISVILPVFNEEDSIPILYKRLVDAINQFTISYEFIFINDGSTDGSLLEIIKLTELDHRVRYINFSRNFGHQEAVSAGLDFCSGMAVVIMDTDLQDPPELIPNLFKEYKKGFQVVYAKRKHRTGETFFKKITAKTFYRILEKISPIKIPLDAGDFRLLDAKVIMELRKMPEKNKFLRGQIAWLGFKQTFVLFDRDSRMHGKSGYSTFKMFKLALDGITGFSNFPLLLVTRLGFIISVFSFLTIVYAVFSHFILKETITGWTSLIISIMFIGGIQLLSIGIIGEYINRISKDVKNRPLYIIDETNIK